MSADKKKDFGQNPFKQLKGFSASAPEKKKTPPKKEAPKPEPLSRVDDAALFEAEMSFLDVERRPGAVIEEPAREKGEPVRKKEEPAPPKPEAKEDQDLFLNALGSMDAVFRDELPEPEEAPAAPRRMKQVRKGRLIPEDKLDLHGMTREEARGKVRYFLEDCVHYGMKTVLVITGRGKTSQAEPVLRADMERYLTVDAKAWVVEWGRAPQQYGGEGALVVFLKGRN